LREKKGNQITSQGVEEEKETDKQGKRRASVFTVSEAWGKGKILFSHGDKEKKKVAKGGSGRPLAKDGVFRKARVANERKKYICHVLNSKKEKEISFFRKGGGILPLRVGSFYGKGNPVRTRGRDGVPGSFRRG